MLQYCLKNKINVYTIWFLEIKSRRDHTSLNLISMMQLLFNVNTSSEMKVF